VKKIAVRRTLSYILAFVMLATSFVIAPNAVAFSADELFADNFIPFSSEPTPDFDDLFALFNPGEELTDWTAPFGSNFAAGDVWEFTASHGAATRVNVAEVGTENHYLSFPAFANQGGNRNLNRRFGTADIFGGHHAFVTFDLMPGGSPPPLAHVVNHRIMDSIPATPAYAPGIPLLTFTSGLPDAGFGAIGGNYGANVDPMTLPEFVQFPSVTAIYDWQNQWFTFGISIDFYAGNAVVRVSQRGADALLGTYFIPISGTQIAGFQFNAVRVAPLGNMYFAGSALDNLFFFSPLNNDLPHVSATAVAISPEAPALQFSEGTPGAGQTVTVSAAVSPATATDQTVSWTIDNIAPGGEGNPLVVEYVPYQGGLVLNAIGSGTFRVVATALGSEIPGVVYDFVIITVAGSEILPDFDDLLPLLFDELYEDWEVLFGSAFPLGDVWGFGGHGDFTSRSVTEMDGTNIVNHYMQWFSPTAQGGGRLTTRNLPSAIDGGARAAVLFDLRPGVVIGNPSNVTDHVFLDAGVPLLTIRTGTPAADDHRIGAFGGVIAGAQAESFDNAAFVEFDSIADVADWQNQWFTFGILFDFFAQEATVVIMERGGMVLGQYIVPISGYGFNAVRIDTSRVTGNVLHNNHGLDNLFFLEPIDNAFPSLYPTGVELNQQDITMQSGPYAPTGQRSATVVASVLPIQANQDVVWSVLPVGQEIVGYVVTGNSIALTTTDAADAPYGVVTIRATAVEFEPGQEPEYAETTVTVTFVGDPGVALPGQVGSVIDFEDGLVGTVHTNATAGLQAAGTPGSVGIHNFAGNNVLRVYPGHIGDPGGWAAPAVAADGSFWWTLPLNEGEWNINDPDDDFDLVTFSFNWWVEYVRPWYNTFDVRFDAGGSTFDNPAASSVLRLMNAGVGGGGDGQGNSHTGNNIRAYHGIGDMYHRATGLANNVPNTMPRHTQINVTAEFDLLLQTVTLTMVNAATGAFLNGVAGPYNAKVIQLPDGSDEITHISFGAYRQGGNWNRQGGGSAGGIWTAALEATHGGRIDNILIIAEDTGRVIADYAVDVVITPASAQVVPGFVQAVAASVLPTVIPNRDVVWSIYPPTGIARFEVNPTDGNTVNVFAVGNGTATLRATAVASPAGEPVYSEITITSSTGDPTPNFAALLPLLNAGVLADWNVPTGGTGAMNWDTLAIIDGADVIATGFTFPGAGIGGGAVQGWGPTAEEFPAGHGARGVANIVGGAPNHFLQWHMNNQSGGRSVTRILPSTISGSETFVSFDLLPGTVNQRSGVGVDDQTAIDISFRYGAATFFAIRIGRDGGDIDDGGSNLGNMRIGATGNSAILGAASVDFRDKWNFDHTEFICFERVMERPNWYNEWFTVGIRFDFLNQAATITILLKGTDIVVDEAVVYFTGTQFDRIVLDGRRKGANNMTFGGGGNATLGIDNMFFFYKDFVPNTVARVYPLTPAGIIGQATVWPNLFTTLPVGTPFAQLGLPTHVDVRTIIDYAGTLSADLISVPVTWRVVELPWVQHRHNLDYAIGEPGHIPYVFNPAFHGVFTFEAVLEDIPGVAYNFMGMTTQRFIELREDALHNHPRQMEWLNRGMVAVPARAPANTAANASFASRHNMPRPAPGTATHGILVQWRLLATEYFAGNVTFDLYRNGQPLIRNLDHTNFVDRRGNVGDVYTLYTRVDGVLSGEVNHFTAWANNHLDIALQQPTVRLNPAIAHPSIIVPPSLGFLQGGIYGYVRGSTGTATYSGRFNTEYISYTANDLSVGDVTGDGTYDILVRWQPSGQADPGLQPRHTGETIFDMVSFCPQTGASRTLWRLNLGINITSSEHHSVMHVWDFNQNGFADFAIKIADGTRLYHPNADGIILESHEGGTPVWVHGDPDAVWVGGLPLANPGVSSNRTFGRVNEGPEYFAVLCGRTGAIISYVPYFAPYNIMDTWGDNWQNRSDRFGGVIAYMPYRGIDGNRPYPTIIEVRGHYGPWQVGAYQLVRNAANTGYELILIWTFDLREWGVPGGGNQGNHNFTVADVTGTGYDDVNLGSITINHRGEILWVATGTRGTIPAAHGDALHQSRMLPPSISNEFYRMSPHEAGPPHNVTVFNAANGRPVVTFSSSSGDVGRGVAGNITPQPGFEFWGAGGTAARNLYTGQTVGRPTGVFQNHLVYWTGDLLREDLDGIQIAKFNYDVGGAIVVLQEFAGMASNNGTKANPGIHADLFGDWREEVVMRHADNQALRIFVTDFVTDYVLPTLMHDPAFRQGVAWQNAVYNQPQHLSFYLGYSVRQYVLNRDFAALNMFTDIEVLDAPAVITIGTIEIVANQRDLAGLNVYIDGNLGFAQMTLRVDIPEFFEFDGFTAGAGFAGLSIVVYEGAGYLLITLSGNSDVVGNGILLTLHFDIGATTQQYVAITAALVNPISGVFNAPVNTAGAIVRTASELGMVSIRRLGDANADGRLTLADASFLARVIAGTITEYTPALFDVVGIVPVRVYTAPGEFTYEDKDGMEYFELNLMPLVNWLMGRGEPPRLQ